MTHLERLIQTAVQHTTATTISRSTELIAEQLAREILNDPAWRRQMRALIELHVQATWTHLAQEVNGGRRKKKPTRRAR